MDGRAVVEFDAYYVNGRLPYTFTFDGKEIFKGNDFKMGQFSLFDENSREAAIALLGFLTLRPGDTDAEYFDKYTPEQMEWAKSSECEYLSYEVPEEERMGHR